MTEVDGLEVTVNQGFDRLQQKLMAMNVGDEISASVAAEETGLSVEVCRAVLHGLERAGLMTHGVEDRYTRCTLDLMRS